MKASKITVGSRVKVKGQIGIVSDLWYNGGTYYEVSLDTPIWLENGWNGRGYYRKIVGHGNQVALVS